MQLLVVLVAASLHAATSQSGLTMAALETIIETSVDSEWKVVAEAYVENWNAVLFEVLTQQDPTGVIDSFSEDLEFMGDPITNVPLPFKPLAFDYADATDLVLGRTAGFGPFHDNEVPVETVFWPIISADGGPQQCHFLLLDDFCTNGKPAARMG